MSLTTTVNCVRCEKRAEILITKNNVAKTAVVLDAFSQLGAVAGVYRSGFDKPVAFLCSACLDRAMTRRAFTSAEDEKKFRGWIKRIEAGLGAWTKDASADEQAPRMALIHEIHDDAAERYPLGIAERLHEVVASLNLGGDEGAKTYDLDAIDVLEDLAEDERKARELNPGRAL